MFDCSLARYTSYAIGGPADALVVVHEKNKIAPLLDLLERESVSWRVIGKGTNLLVRDNGYRGVVIVLGKEISRIDDVTAHGSAKVLLRVGAGCSLTKLNHHCCRYGLGGIEFSYGIPGSLGGAVLMNAGAWGGELADVIDEVGVITKNGYEKVREDQLDFTYRRWSGFSSYVGRGLIVDVLLKLKNVDPQWLVEKTKKLLEQRKAIQPHNFPNGGSVFKNPQNDSAGRLIDECGLKGKSVGGAMVSEKHANFIINLNKATAADVISLMKIVQDEVKKRFDIELEPEIHVM